MRDRFIRELNNHLDLLDCSGDEDEEKTATINFFNEITAYWLAEPEKDNLARLCGFRDARDLLDRLFTVLFEYLRRNYKKDKSRVALAPLYGLAGNGRDFGNELDYFAGKKDASPLLSRDLVMLAESYGKEQRAYQTIFDLPYGEQDSASQSLNVYIPTSAKDGSLPLVLFFHGGAWLTGHRISAIRRFRHYSHSQVIFVSVGYRLSREAGWPAQIDDCLAAFRYVQENAFSWGADSKRIALWGSSAGAHLAALLAGKVSGEVCGLVDFCGPIDLESHAAKAIGAARNVSPVIQLLGDHPQTMDWARQASVHHQVSLSYPRTLIVHGEKDDVVPLTESCLFANKLKENNVEFDLLVLPDCGHRLDELVLIEPIKKFFQEIFQ
jgi:acetyl esterase/lipase